MPKRMSWQFTKTISKQPWKVKNTTFSIPKIAKNYTLKCQKWVKFWLKIWIYESTFGAQNITKSGPLKNENNAY